MSNPTTLLDAAGVTESANGPLVNVPVGANLHCTLVATENSGTANLDATLEWSIDGTNWFSESSADDFAQKTATGTEFVTFTVKGPYARVAYTITGSGDWDLTVVGYATP